ncbi:MAG: DUF4331 domain-containing protein [Phycisphaerales bacterium]|nr:DUF4331 domain-containing protein [Phycisphaerales bacterium]
MSFLRGRSARLAAAVLVVGMLLGVAKASSHREAPYITEHPKVDATDFYMFRAYEPGREDYVVLVANYVPLQNPYGGPNYFQLDPEAVYEIHIDNNGDAIEDITFQFQFNNTLQDIQLPIGTGDNAANVSIPLVQAGQIFAGNTSALNVVESYTVTMVEGDRRTGSASPVWNFDTGAMDFAKPVDNIGTKTLPDYEAYAAQHMYTIGIPGCAQQGRMFVGQRKDSFVVNLGEIFDLVNVTNPLGPVDAEHDDLDDANVTSLVLELPISCVRTEAGSTIGAWTTASLPKKRKLKTNATFERPSSESGEWVQVSRLGMPLVNEIVIGLKDKNRFNASEPMNDLAQFATYVTNPTFPALLEILFFDAGVRAPTAIPRADLVAAFVTGIDGLNANGGVGEMVRLNLDIPPTAADAQSNLGVLGADLAGFPNGRRLGDDVVDIELRVAMGVLLPIEQAPSGQLPFTDGAYVDSSYFDAVFPYLKTPLAGSPNNTP